MQIEPIGFFHSATTYKYEVPRQGAFFAGHLGRIELISGKGFEQALRDLEGFERLWIIFHFHHNEGWRPTTRPPVPPIDHERVGVFASRSPYRPNPIGLSCVRLVRMEGLVLFVDEVDLLDGSPVFDIKPYIPLADAFPEAKAGWVETQATDLWKVQATGDFLAQSEWIYKRCGLDVLNFAEVQLSRSPFDASRKRIRMADENPGMAELAYRTFRIDFAFDAVMKNITLRGIRSGYTQEELQSDVDIYGDKTMHREFLKR